MKQVTVWWLNPGLAFASASVPVILLAYWISPQMYAEQWRMVKYFDLKYTCLSLVCVAAFVAGSALKSINPGRVVRGPKLDAPARAADTHWQTVLFFFNVSFYLCAAGYALWIASGVRRGLTIGLLLSSILEQRPSIYVLKNEYLVTIPGLTTLTQFGIAAGILGCLTGFGLGWRRVWLKLATIFALSVLRALVNSERLAIFETAVPILVLWLRYGVMESTRMNGAARLVVTLAPALGSAVMVVVFTAFEYSRSWTLYFSKSGGSLMEFGAMRLLGYYATALNNGAFLLTRMAVPMSAPYFTFIWLWHFPVLKDVFENTISRTPVADEFYMAMLSAGANPEFNNQSGLFLPVLDYGLWAGPVFWFLTGIFAGAIYRLFIAKHPLGLMTYPLFYIGVIEIARILYWVDGRAFPAWCFLYTAAAAVMARKPIAFRERTFA